MRGTVYVVDAEGRPRRRQVVELHTVNDALEFRHTACRYHEQQGDLRDGGRVEFGPVGESWGTSTKGG